MKTKLLMAALITMISTQILAASIEEVRAVIETEITRLEEEKNLVCIDTEKEIALRGLLDRHTETIQYACKAPILGSKVVYINLTMKNSKIRGIKGPIEDYTMNKVSMKSGRLH